MIGLFRLFQHQDERLHAKEALHGVSSDWWWDRQRNHVSSGFLLRHLARGVLALRFRVASCRFDP